MQNITLYMCCRGYNLTNYIQILKLENIGGCLQNITPHCSFSNAYEFGERTYENYEKII